MGKNDTILKENLTQWEKFAGSDEKNKLSAGTILKVRVRRRKKRVQFATQKITKIRMRSLRSLK